MVTAGGLAIIASILGILLFIVLEVLPLGRGASVRVEEAVSLEGPPLLAMVADELHQRVAGIARDGSVVVIDPVTGALVSRHPVLEESATLTSGGAQAGSNILTLATDDGRVFAVPVGFRVNADRRSEVEVGAPVELALDPAAGPLGLHSVSIDDEGNGFAAAVLASGSLVVARLETTENMLSGESSATVEIEAQALTSPLTALMIDHRQRDLFAGTARGELLWWDLRNALPQPAVVSAGSSAITAMTLLIGGRSLVVGQDDGTISVWFPVRVADEHGNETSRLTRIRDLPRRPAAVRLLAPSLRTKSFLAYDSGGSLALDHSTSDRQLWTGGTGVADATAIAIAPRGDAAFIAGSRAVAQVAIENPHPETSLGTLFSRVWYEGYDRPELVWQSSGGSDDFEPKLSLTPLLVGTLKGTIFSLLLAMPIAVLGAIYVSQFMHPAYQRWVKPMVEVMAALPTVVLGFLAGLWLAPELERMLPGLALLALLLPILVIAAATLWRRLPARISGRFLAGTELFVLAAVIAVAIGLALRYSAPLEAALFGGDFQVWLEAASGLRYDQRNAIVVGLAMGFAVIPIIFAISEDALTNVPRNLVAGSLALGASRWQTVLRVVLPTASPGIFSAIMVGFGRAVGETMIVLMATGNTPILSMSPFNGFRTLSASIAVEIPEAPVGGTLYRTLFLAALVLFFLTFLVNTVAELVRQRLRDRYARL